jgi:hypothetical protein
MCSEQVAAPVSRPSLWCVNGGQEQCTGFVTVRLWLLGATLEPGDHCAFCLPHTNNNLLVRHLRRRAYAAAMIRDGKQQGWLFLPVDTLPVWAAFNSVSFDGVNIGPLPGKEDRGSTVIAKRSLKGHDEPPLMTIPRDLILSLDRIQEHAKSDSDFRAVLEGLDEFGRVGLTFLPSSLSPLCFLSHEEYMPFISHYANDRLLAQIHRNENHNHPSITFPCSLYHSFSTTADLVSDC